MWKVKGVRYYDEFFLEVEAKEIGSFVFILAKPSAATRGDGTNVKMRKHLKAFSGFAKHQVRLIN